jgi:alkaline phosphatase D
LKTLPIYDKVNFIVVSDHGMTNISSDKFINLSNYVNKDWFEFISGSNPVYLLQPKEEFRQLAYKELKKIPNLKVWYKDSIPAQYHYGKNPRICDIVIETDLGYSVSWADDYEGYTGGTHGYDPYQPDMQGIFYAVGPAFKRNYVQKSFQNINIYPLIAHLLKIKPEKVDGNLEEIKGMLK